MPLYHKDVYLPDAVTDLIPIGKVRLTHSNHAVAQARRKYGLTLGCLPSIIDIGIPCLLEVEIINGKIAKLVVRVKFDKVYDICLPLVKKGEVYMSKTMWLNRSDDNHKTLNKNLYARVDKADNNSIIRE